MNDDPEPFAFETVGPPALAAVDPPDGAVDVELGSPITLTFSTLMDTASVEEALTIEPAFAHDLVWSGRLLQIIPTEALEPGTDYRVTVDGRATDLAGVRLRQPAAVAWRTVPPGLEVEAIVPEIGIDGIAVTSPIAIIFDEPIDPESVSDDLVTVTPAVGGTVGVTPLPGDAVDESGAGRALVFRPSAPLPANTTFTVEVLPGMRGLGGESLPGPLSWTFTTGVAASRVSNQITFITARGGVENLWAMNPDGSGQRQLSAELAPVVDYVIAPDGESLVVSDGRRLVYQRADGSERRVLTGADVARIRSCLLARWPARRLCPRRCGQRVRPRPVGVAGRRRRPRARLDSDGGRDQPGSSSDRRGRRPNCFARHAMPRMVERSPSSTVAARSACWTSSRIASRCTPSSPVVRRYGSRTARASSSPARPTGRPRSRSLRPCSRCVRAPMTPCTRFRWVAEGRRECSPPGSAVIAVAVDGLIVYSADGGLWLTELDDDRPGERILDDVLVRNGGFAPGGAGLVIEINEPGVNRVELVDTETGDRTRMVTDARRPRWQP